jgi:hypothetical protein
MRAALCLTILTLSACSAPGGPYPSLRPRAAETIDPRLPVERPINNRPVSPALAGQLEALVDRARTGNAAFETAIAEAERLSASAGAPQTEGWIAAEEALTAAIAARKATATALADIDDLAGRALQTQQGIAPNDLAAIHRASAEAGALDETQAARVAAIQKRLGL